MSDKLDCLDVDEIIKFTTNRIKSTYIKILLEVKKKNSAVWCNSRLDIERRRVRALRRKYQVETDPSKREELCNIFKKERARYKKGILIRKRTSFKEFLSKVTLSGTFGAS